MFFGTSQKVPGSNPAECWLFCSLTLLLLMCLQTGLLQRCYMTVFLKISLMWNDKRFNHGHVCRAFFENLLCSLLSPCSLGGRRRLLDEAAEHHAQAQRPDPDEGRHLHRHQRRRHSVRQGSSLASVFLLGTLKFHLSLWSPITWRQGMQGHIPFLFFQYIS